jgi:hypothetical protein
MVIAFDEDQSLPELTAVADRQTLEDILSIPWLPRETAREFRSRHERDVAEYDQFSEVPRFSSTVNGDKEHIEYILKRVRRGPLKNLVTTEWDLQNLKLKAESKSKPQLRSLGRLSFSSRFSRTRRLGSSLSCRPRLKRSQANASSTEESKSMRLRQEPNSVGTFKLESAFQGQPADTCTVCPQPLRSQSSLG